MSELKATVKKPKKNYISNKDFYASLVKYRDACEDAKQNGKIKPIIPNDIGLCFMRLANNYASKSNFYHCPYKNDMVSEALLTCVQYVSKFDPEKSQNPFAYFTMVVHNAFIQRINKENRQLNIKKKYIKTMSEDGIYDQDGESVDSNYVNHMSKQFDDYDSDMARFDLRSDDRTPVKKKSR